jgi:ankyrin repeat protein
MTPDKTALKLLLWLLVGCCAAAARAETINEAVHRGDLAAVRRMLRANPTLARFRGDDSNTPLHWASWDGRADIAALLVDAGADVNDRRAMDGGTPLWLAGWQGRTDVVRLLLQHGADPEVRSNDGNTPLHEAAAYGHEDTVERFLIAHQNIDTLNKEGDTPLGVAAVWGQPDIARCLIGNGADVNHRNNQGQTIVDVAMAHRHPDFAEVVRNYQLALTQRATRDAARKALAATVRAGYQNWRQANSRQQRVYNADFVGSNVSPEWSTRSLPGAQQAPLQISTTPQRGRRFLGELGSQAVRLSLTALPAHTEVSLTFDLYIIRTWDGNDLRFGPDVFTLDVVNGPTLLRTTFNNPISFDRQRCTTQAYPGEYAGDFNPPRTGAVEVDTLGYTIPFNGANVPLDATYEISYTFAHQGGDLAFDFAAQGLEALDNESWGIANVQVSVAGAAPAPVLAGRSVPTSAARTPRATPRAIGRHVSPPKARSVTRRAVTAVKKPTASRTTKPPARLHAKEKPPGL